MPYPRIQIRTSQHGTFEVGPIASTIAVLAGLSGLGNFIINFINFGARVHWWH
jgi:hypothetical protein